MKRELGVNEKKVDVVEGGDERINNENDRQKRNKKKIVESIEDRLRTRQTDTKEIIRTEYTRNLK